jgi:hypothetical protein
VCFEYIVVLISLWNISKKNIYGVLGKDNETTIKFKDGNICLFVDIDKSTVY